MTSWLDFFLGCVAVPAVVAAVALVRELPRAYEQIRYERAHGVPVERSCLRRVFF